MTPKIRTIGLTMRNRIRRIYATVKSAPSLHSATWYISKIITTSKAFATPAILPHYHLPHFRSPLHRIYSYCTWFHIKIPWVSYVGNYIFASQSPVQSAIWLAVNQTSYPSNPKRWMYRENVKRFCLHNKFPIILGRARASLFQSRLFSVHYAT